MKLGAGETHHPSQLLLKVLFASLLQVAAWGSLIDHHGVLPLPFSLVGCVICHDQKFRTTNHVCPYSLTDLSNERLSLVTVAHSSGAEHTATWPTSSTIVPSRRPLGVRCTRWVRMGCTRWVHMRWTGRHGVACMRCTRWVRMRWTGSTVWPA